VVGLGLELGELAFEVALEIPVGLLGLNIRQVLCTSKSRVSLISAGSLYRRVGRGCAKLARAGWPGAPST
jgi:hypothetical protein